MYSSIIHTKDRMYIDILNLNIEKTIDQSNENMHEHTEIFGSDYSHENTQTFKIRKKKTPKRETTKPHDKKTNIQGTIKKTADIECNNSKLKIDILPDKIDFQDIPKQIYLNPTTHFNTKLINRIFGRDKIYNEIKHILESFDKNLNNVLFKKGIYIYGSSGCGKTDFVVSLLEDLHYDVIQYDAGDIRNKNLIDSMTSNNLSNYNVLQMMRGVKKKIAIIMDEIDGMNNGDKGGLTSLIKLIRQKKTKKQKLENRTVNPIVCIGNYYSDKKIKELVKVCNTFELLPPTQKQMQSLIEYMIPEITHLLSPERMQSLLNYIQSDIRKFKFIFHLYQKRPELVLYENLDELFHTKKFNENAKINTKRLINEPISLEKHSNYLNDTDRTIVSLLYHENIIDMIEKEPNKKRVFELYHSILNNICYADYMDRITFQKQIWVFNEMSSLIKTFYSNKLYHDHFPQNRNCFHPTEVRFTKILTKYSTEYNNILFFFNLSQQLDMERKDVVAFFQDLQYYYGEQFYLDTDKMNHVEKAFENYKITKLDVKRIYRFLEKNVKKEEEDMIESFDVIQMNIDNYQGFVSEMNGGMEEIF